jgi:glycine/D-amino acid oxidase-like deaminating enzyme
LINPASERLDTDVLIVGGGILGCSAALYAAKEGLETVLLEEHDLHTGASGANAGNLHQQLLTAKAFKSYGGWEWIERYAGMIRFYASAISFWIDLAKEFPTDVELKVLGGISVAETEADMKIVVRKAALERAHGGDSIVLTKHELHAMAPYLSDRLIGGCYSPSEGKANPLLALPAITQLAAKNGARFLRREKALQVERSAHGYTVKSDQRVIGCKRLILAAGPKTPELARQLGIEVPIRANIIQVAITEATTPMMAHLLYHVTRPLTMKQVTNGNVVMGGGWSGIEDATTKYPFVRRESITGNAWTAQRVVPAVSQLHLLRAWASHIFTSADGWPICGAVPGYPNLYLNVSNSYGFTLGPLLGRLIGEMLAGQEPSMDMNPLRLGRQAERR